MSITLDEFIESVTTSGLMDAEEIQSFLETLPMENRPTSAEDLAKDLYRLGKLTKFQAQAIYQRKTRGLVVGNYTVLDKLGKGGMGAVYKAQHKRMKRIVALKMLPSTATKSSDSVKRFQQEVEAAARLTHPNIVTAHDADEAKGVHFLVMEYVEGQDLYALVKGTGTLSVARAVDYITQAAKGLEYAHSQGVIHRDIKPHNLLLDQKGTVKILDMGLARIEEKVSGKDATADEGLTQSGQVMGTLDYMPPEQALDTSTVDVRADIYSLGCTLHYLLAGRPPYSGDTVGKKIVAHREQPIPSLRQLRSDVPQSLDAVFQKMLGKRSEDRQQSMTEVISQLQGCTLQQGVAAPTSFPPSSGSYAETVDLKREDTEPPSQLLSPLDELFASEPVQITERLIAPSFRYRKRSTKQQKVLVASIAGGAAVVLLLLGIILKMRTSEGTLVVEIDQPDATVQVLDGQGKVLIERKGQQGTMTIGVDPGNRRLRVAKDGVELFAKDFTIAAGGKEVIKAKLIPASEPAKPPSTQAEATTAEAQRQLAEWVIGKGGYVHVEGDPSDHRIASSNDIPAAPFRVDVVHLTDAVPKVTDGDIAELRRRCQTLKILNICSCTAITDEAIRHLAGMRLQYLMASDTSISDTGLGYLKDIQVSWELNLTGTKVTDDGLEHLKAVPQLASLYLDKTQIGDAGLRHLAPLGKLGLLGLSKTTVTDEGMSILAKDHPNLTQLLLTDTQVGDAGLKHLYVLTNPGLLNLTGTKVSAEGVKALKAALPKWTVIWEPPPGQSMGAAPESLKPTATPTGPKPPPAIAPFDAPKAKGHQDAWAKHLGVPVEETNSIGMNMALIPAGEFEMGSTPEEIAAELERAKKDNKPQWYLDAIPNEGPRHHVRITKPFFLGMCQVTQDEYDRVMGVNPSAHCVRQMDASVFKPSLDQQQLEWRAAGAGLVAGKDTTRHPVEMVNWEEAMEFCRRLSAMPAEQSAKRSYRLPTEAEWEYACRAGTMTVRFCGDDEASLGEYAWFRKNSGMMTHPVGEKKPNAWGLYDIHGHVWQWCSDWVNLDYYKQSPSDDPIGPPTGSARVLRGGGWYDLPSDCSAFRHGYSPEYRRPDVGFRVVVEIAPRAEVGMQSVEEGFVSLFDGKTLNGWQGATERYSVQDGKIVVDFGPQSFHGQGGHLSTIKEYKDFVLRLEYTVSSAANNGILLRAPLNDKPWEQAVEVQVLDDSAPPWQSLPPQNLNGSLFGIVAVNPGHLKPPSQWNSLEIQWKGRRVQVTLNGATVVYTNLDDPSDKAPNGLAHPGLKREQGHIAFLGYASQGKVEYRNIRLKDLSSPSEKEKPQASEADREDKAVIAPQTDDSKRRAVALQAKDWIGLPQCWRITRQGIMGSTGPQGIDFNTFLCTKKTYRNFELSCQVRLITGNTGVQFRSDYVDQGKFVLRGPQVDVGPGVWGNLYGEKTGSTLKEAPAELVKRIVKPDAFNDVFVRCVGKHVTIKINNETTVDGEFPTIADEGAMGLQLLSGKTEAMFRNIRLKELGD